MSNLIPSQNDIAKKMVNSLSQRIHPLRSRFSNETIILLDTSVSMKSLTDGNITRIDALKNALKEVGVGTTRMFQFNSFVEEITMETELIPHGSTYLLEALFEMKNQQAKNLILITDGEPSDPQGCLDYAYGMDFTINTVFVGNPDNQNAIQFCKDLAKQNKGQFVENPMGIKTIAALPQTIRLMLSAGEEKGNGPIAL